ncbi:MAG: ACP phosphodiesterase [Cyclobacteriaceae bacterium]
MNFLAHSYLSGSSEPILVGNFIGDFVKGKAFETYPDEIRNGIWLHREIDSYTDSHPEVRKCRKRLWPNFHHYAGVVIDLFNDHLLAVEWSAYSATPLEEFAGHVYKTMQRNDDILPAGARRMLPYMIDGNWLVSYGTLSGIDRALTGLSQRTSFRSNMENASRELARDYDFYRESFQNFFPDLMSFVDDKNPYFNLPDFE